jgi:hypothetical protein
MTKDIKYKYLICYRDDSIKKASGRINRIEAEFTGVRSLAKFLNSFKTSNPSYFVLIALMQGDGGKTYKPVRFLNPEYKAQKWLTGYKERLLANAIESKMDIKWNHGLKAVERSRFQ